MLMNETLFSLYAALPSTWRVKDESDAKRYFQLFMKMLGLMSAPTGHAARHFYAIISA